MIKAKKKFGQNFLKDSTVLNKIIQAIPNDLAIINSDLVEIGPGLGDLTKELLAVSRVRSYEIDKDLYEILKQSFKKELEDGQFELILGDALEIWQKEGLSKNSYYLVANLPYYIATNIILKAIDDEKCLGFIVMIQREVALKFVMAENKLNSLAVIADLNGEMELLFDVPPTSFEPPPKVMSSVVKFSKKEKFNTLEKDDYPKFKEFLKRCFASPRKTLAKNLNLPKEQIDALYSELDLDKSIRSHQLNTTLLIKIFNYLKVKNGREQN
ncbi:MAG: 16S rRNA (adenine(1518)-N(6)/adenine(1519)-N(6))-dimethyltransferase RsmA [Campylobacteraceae bacterium]|nr:16S rRNA (adenine(1518)-N(6)/adenine(1519)-N(6))-dimethyltransferase RsmA [Campylobacteraceae bacterium]